MRQVLDFRAQKTTRRRDKQSSWTLQQAENKPKLKLEVEKVKNNKKDDQHKPDRPARNGNNTSKKGGRTSNTSPRNKNKHNLYAEDEKIVDNKPADNPLQVLETTKKTSPGHPEVKIVTIIRVISKR